MLPVFSNDFMTLRRVKVALDTNGFTVPMASGWPMLAGINWQNLPGWERYVVQLLCNKAEVIDQQDPNATALIERVPPGSTGCPKSGQPGLVGVSAAMATRTILQPNRAYDHIYDPTYTTSHPNDHYRQTSKAMFNAQRIERVPDDKYLFSELPHYPRCTIQAGPMATKPALPRLQLHAEKEDDAKSKEKVEKSSGGFFSDPLDGTPYETNETTAALILAIAGALIIVFFLVTSKEALPKYVDKDWFSPAERPPDPLRDVVHGTYRFKFQAWPNKQMLSTLPHIVQYAFKSHGASFPTEGAQAEPPTKTVATQSVYRESEAQTDPYSPDYQISSQVPEVLQLTHLTYGAGLPASEAELQIIERTRQKRIFKQMLPPPCDEFGMEVRVQLMEAQEFREWADRDRTIRELQVAGNFHWKWTNGPLELNCQEKRLQLLRQSSFPRGDVGRAKFWLNVRLCCSQFLEMERGQRVWVHVKGGERALKISAKEHDDVNDVLKKTQTEVCLTQVRADLLKLYPSAKAKDQGERAFLSSTLVRDIVGGRSESSAFYVEYPDASGAPSTETREMLKALKNVEEKLEVLVQMSPANFRILPVPDDLESSLRDGTWSKKVKAHYQGQWQFAKGLGFEVSRSHNGLLSAVVVPVPNAAFEERDMQRESAQTGKIDRVRQRKEEERDRKLAACQRLRTKVLRKMQKERTKADSDNVRKRDVIAEYADFTSQVYAPLARNGHVPDYNTAKIEVQPSDLASFPGLVQLEASLHPSVLRATEKHPKDDMDAKKKSSHQLRKELEMTTALKTAMESIKKELQQNEGDSKGENGLSAGGLKKFHLRNVLDRPDSPREKNDVLPEEEEQESAVLLLQRIIRGRAFQNLMFEGKEKRLDLINELRAAERFAETATRTEEKRYIDQLRDKAFEGVLESVQGSIISQTLDQLSKELLRFQEERRIAAMVKLAERDRQDRQAMESGRRQAEERLREREDEMFRQIMGVHQGTVDSYLEDVLTSTVEEAAQTQALTEARLKAAYVNQVVDMLEASAQEPDVVVRELVHTFNLPHVQREVIQRRIAQENKRFSEAARGALDETYKRVTEHVNPTS
eukprot:symbB.v1.2.012691.t3/scaffold880.1/size155533/13